MKITSLEIERFGLWSGLTLPNLSDGINVFYGANETGKSTILEFIRAILYGFGEDRQHFLCYPQRIDQIRKTDEHADQSRYLVSGGILQMETRSGEKYQLRRIFTPDRQGSKDQIDIQTPDGVKQGSQFLRALVSGVDEQTFNNVFAIGLDELQQLASLNDTDAAEMLFRLSVGIDRVSIVDTIKELSTRRNNILHIAETEGKPSRLTQLLIQREKIASDFSESKNLIRQYAGLQNEQRIVDRTIAHLEEDRAKLLKEKRFYEIAQTAEPIWIRRNHVQDEIDAMGNVVSVADSVIKQLDGIEQELTERKAAYDKVKEEYQKAKKAITSLPISDKITQLTPRIEFLLEEESRIVELDKEIADLESEIGRYNKLIAEEESKLREGNYPLPQSDIHVSELTPKDSSNSINNISSPSVVRYHRSSETVQAGVLEEYRSYAKAVSQARKRLAKAQSLHGELLQRSRDVNDRLKMESVKHETDNFGEAMERAGEMVTQLRRRQSIGQKMNEMMQHHKELRRINAFLIQNQALPGWMLGLMVLSGLVGALCLGLGFFPTEEIDSNLPIILILLGCIMIVVPVVIKILSEKNNAKKLEQNQRQLATLSGQIDRAKQEASAIDAQFPSSSTATIEMRLQEAQQECVVLEKLMPLETQRQEVSQQLKQIEVRQGQYKERYTDAVKRWNEWIRRVGLPADWTPIRIRDYLKNCDVVGDLKKELDRRCDIVNQRIKDVKGITNRIDTLIAEIDMPVSDGASYVQILGEIRKRLQDNQQAIQKRKKLIKGIKEFKKMRRKVVSDLQKTKQNEHDLFQQYGVKTAESLRTLNQRYQKLRKLLAQEQGIQRELDAAIGQFCTESALSNLLEPRITRKELEKKINTENAKQLDGEEGTFQSETMIEELARLKSLPEIDDLLQETKKRIETLSAKLHEELQNRGQLAEQLKRLADDKTILQKHRELSIVDEKIKIARSEWQVYAVCARMLDEIRSTYERDRQPRTLSEASELLKQLTEGKYQRIWTPLGDETLRVDDRAGNSFDLSWVSRGTREQIFIALRLALASEFARHGSILPLVLDDVLVNFDTRRALAAIQVLREVASAGSGRQIILFTCHEHICRMFQKNDIPVRMLPSVEEPDKPMRVLKPLSLIEWRKRKRLRQQKRLEAESRERQIAEELARREESIRLDAIRRAEVHRLIVQMQQQATAEKVFEADQTQKTVSR